MSPKSMVAELSGSSDVFSTAISMSRVARLGGKGYIRVE